MSRVSPFDEKAPVALFVLVVVMVSTAIGLRVAAQALNVYLQKEPVELRANLDVLPSRLGPWAMQGESRKFGAELVEELGTSLYVDRTYAIEGDPTAPVLALHIAYYTGMIDAVPHVPDRCLVAGGFNANGRPRNLELPIDLTGYPEDAGPVNAASKERYRLATRRDPLTGRSTDVRMPIGDLAIRTTGFTSDKLRGEAIWAGYFFIANGRVAITPEDVKRIAFMPSERSAYYCKIQVLGSGKGLTDEAFVRHAATLIEPLLPELMHCLPDWSEVEAQDGVVAQTAAR